MILGHQFYLFLKNNNFSLNLDNLSLYLSEYFLGIGTSLRLIELVDEIERALIREDDCFILARIDGDNCRITI